jgi:MFS family permease
VSGASSVEHELALSHWGYLAFVYALPLALAALLEAGTALFSDVWSRPRLIVLGQASLAASLFLAAWTSSPWGLTLGLALAGAASGVACGAAQALLFADRRGDAEGAMVRWSLYCALGDVLAPLATATAIASGHSYRAAMASIALVVSVQCGVSVALDSRERHGDAPRRDREDEDGSKSFADAVDSVRVALSHALGLPRLWGWLFAAASCTLLDELVVSLVVLRLTHDRAASPALATAAAVTFAMGSIVGASATDRAMERTSARNILLVSATTTALALFLVLASRGAPMACVALFVVGATCAPHHPLALAQAYGVIPERPGTVQAMGQIFVVVDIAAPLALGALADRFGLDVALACLLAQPAIIVACSVVLGRSVTLPPLISGPRR